MTDGSLPRSSWRGHKTWGRGEEGERHGMGEGGVRARKNKINFPNVLTGREWEGVGRVWARVKV